jgi:hypothetical protein
MMMAHDSTSGDPALNPESVAALETALRDFIADDTAAAPLEAALRRIASEARERKMPAEQLLIALKDLWYALPIVERARTDEQQQLLQRIVTMCIRAYYAV